MEYAFYNADEDKYNELLSSAHALDGNPIIKNWREHPTNNELYYRHAFLRACVKISVKKSI